MRFDPKIHNRRSIRLQGYDYSRSGAYFVTLVTQARACLFGRVVDTEMRLNQFGQIVERAWFDLPDHYPHVSLGAFCIMPNHVHGIIILEDTRRGGSVGNVPVPDKTNFSKGSLPDETQTRPYVAIKRHPLSEFVRAFKSFSARRINVLCKTPGVPVWQRNYYEHIIRDDNEYTRIQFYIESNPTNWLEDKENPGKIP